MTDRTDDQVDRIDPDAERLGTHLAELLLAAWRRKRAEQQGGDLTPAPPAARSDTEAPPSA